MIMILGETAIDDLLEMAETWATEGKRLLRLADEVRLEVRQRMERDGAKELMTDRWFVKIDDGQPTYSYANPILEELRPLLAAGEWEKLVAVKEIWDVDKRFLNSLQKRGEQFREILARAVVARLGAVRFTATRRTRET